MKARAATIEEVRSSGKQWNRLVEAMGFPSVFLAHEWVSCWLERFGDGYDPLVLFMTDGGEDLRGVLPLAARKDSTPRTLVFCGAPELYPDHLDVISAPEDARECVRAAAGFLAENHTGWDVLELPYLAEGSALEGIGTGELDARRTGETSSPYIKNTGGIDALLGSFGRKKRYNLRRERRILTEEHGSVVRTPLNAGELDTAMKELFRLHSLRADAKGMESTFDGEPVHAFHADLARRLFEKDVTRLYLMDCGGATVAAVYGFSFLGRFYYYQTGFDPAWQRLGAGKILLMEAIERAFEEGCREFDLLGGDDGYKSYWTDLARPMPTVKVYNRSVTGALAGYADRSRGALVSALRKTNTLGVVKKLIGK